MGYCQLCGKFIKTEKGKYLCYDCWKKKNKKKNTNSDDNNNTNNKSKYITYILKINSEHKHYIGYTNSIKRRLYEHRDGQVKDTKGLEPMLIFFEIFENKEDALHREKVLKNMNNYELNEVIVEFKDLIRELNN